jgi:copper chaperone CopZ
MSTLEELPLTIEFAVSGMTCGACAARIQDQLNKIDGVDASVNYATETATVRTRFGVQSDDLIRAVEEAGGNRGRVC